MPNHTENRLEIECASEHAQKIFELLHHNGQFSYEGLVPMPELVRNTGRGSKTFDGVTYQCWYENHDTGESRPLTPEEIAAMPAPDQCNWYDWAYANWGVKWDAYGHGGPPSVDRWSWGENNKRTTIEVEFRSPWGPPEVWLEKLRARLSEIDPTAHATLQYRLEDDPYYPHSI